MLSIVDCFLGASVGLGLGMLVATSLMRYANRRFRPPEYTWRPRERGLRRG